MSHAINDEALDVIFREARTQNKWQDKPVSPALLMAVYDLMRWGPTSANMSPGANRFRRLERSEGAAEAAPVGRQPRQDDGGAGDRDHRL